MQTAAFGRLALPAKSGRDDGTRTRYEQLEGLLARPLCIHPLFVGMRERIRTFIILFLRQVPRPIWATRTRYGQSGRIRTCEYLLPRQARMAAAERSELNENWLRGKDLNLDLLVQSQPSCRLDDPEKDR